MNKINFIHIIRGHFGTLKDQKGNLIWGDIIVHMLLPIIVAELICYYDGPMQPQTASILVNFGAITTALLMSAIVMIYDQKQKIKARLVNLQKETQSGYRNVASRYAESEPQLQIELCLYDQLCKNISYAILSSIMIVILSVAISFFTKPLVPYSVKIITLYSLSFFCYIFFISTVITFLMIIKRFSSIVGD